MSEFSLKELYDVRLTADYPITLGGRVIEEGETIAYFDRIQISNSQEINSFIEAKGGYGNRGLVVWETAKEINFTFSQGVFSEEQLAIFSNSQITPENRVLFIPKRFNLESDEDSIIGIGQQVYDKIFVYDKESGEKLGYTRVGSDESFGLKINKPFLDVIVDCKIKYENSYKELNIGKKLLNGFIHLDGKTRIKDGQTGIVRTGIIEIPKLRVLSSFNLRLGKDVAPTVATFNAVGYPVGGRGEEEVMRITFLDDDIDSDI